MAKNYYDILGVSKSATQEEVKKAYYKLAHEHHPNKGGDEAKMKEVNEAYGVLGKAEKRKQYDQFGSNFEQAGAGGFGDFANAYRSSGAGGQNFSFDMGDLGDVFGDLFGGGTRRTKTSHNAQGSDIEADLTIDFHDAAFGIEKELKLNKDVVCNKCKGEGAEPGSKVKTCSTCQGTGQIVRSIGFGIGFPTVCPDCNGQGRKAEKNCTQCGGRGTVKDSENIKVDIPAGIDNGQSIRLQGKGQAGPRGSSAGDLYLRIKVLPDIRFRREGFNIITKSEISFTQAALGDKIEIETLDGKVKLKIPEGTQSGKVFSIKGKGVPHLQSKGRGDQLVQVIVKTPKNLSRKQKEILKELDS